MKIYLIRHTAVDVPPGTCYGQTDVPLKDTFETEAETVKKNLEKVQPDEVFSSPLSRCTRLADYCGYGKPNLDDRLKELNFGDWENQIWDEIDMAIWDNDWVNPPAPNGESFMDMYARIESFFDDLKDKPYDNVFVFAHGGVIACSRVYFEKADIKETFQLMPQYGDIVEFEY